MEMQVKLQMGMEMQVNCKGTASGMQIEIYFKVFKIRLMYHARRSITSIETAQAPSKKSNKNDNIKLSNEERKIESNSNDLNLTDLKIR